MEKTIAKDSDLQLVGTKELREIVTSFGVFPGAQRVLNGDVCDGKPPVRPETNTRSVCSDLHCQNAPRCTFTFQHRFRAQQTVLGILSCRNVLVRNQVVDQQDLRSSVFDAAV